MTKPRLSKSPRTLLSPFYNRLAPLSTPRLPYSFPDASEKLTADVESITYGNPGRDPHVPGDPDVMELEYTLSYDPMRAIPDTLWPNRSIQKRIQGGSKNYARPFMRVRSNDPDVMEFILYPDDVRTMLARSSVVENIYLTKMHRTYPDNSLFHTPLTHVPLMRKGKRVANAAECRAEYLKSFKNSRNQRASAARSLTDAARAAEVQKRGHALDFEEAETMSYPPDSLLDYLFPILDSAGLERVRLPHGDSGTHGGVASAAGGLVSPGAVPENSTIMVSSRLIHTLMRMPHGAITMEMASLHPVNEILATMPGMAAKSNQIAIANMSMDETSTLGLAPITELRSKRTPLDEPCWRALLIFGTRRFILPVTSTYSVRTPIFIRIKAIYSEADIAEHGDPGANPFVLPQRYELDTEHLMRQGIVDRAHWCERLGVRPASPGGGASPVMTRTNAKRTTLPILHALMDRRLRIPTLPVGKTWTDAVIDMPFPGTPQDRHIGSVRALDTLRQMLPTVRYNDEKKLLDALVVMIDDVYNNFVSMCSDVYAKYDTPPPGCITKWLTTGYSQWGEAYDLFLLLLMRQKAPRWMYMNGTFGPDTAHNRRHPYDTTIRGDVSKAFQRLVAMLYQHIAYQDPMYTRAMRLVVADATSNLTPFALEDTSAEDAMKHFLRNAEEVVRVQTEIV